MTSAPRYTNLRDYLRVLREQRWLILAIILIVTAATLVVSVRQDSVYEASASLELRSENADRGDLGALVPASGTPEQRAATAARTILSTDVAREAKKRLKSDLTPEQLLSFMRADAETRTNFIVLRVQTLSPGVSEAIAKAFSEAAVAVETRRVREQYEARARDLRRENRQLPKDPSSTFSRSANVDRINKLETLARFAEPMAIAVPASVDPRPVSPRPVRNTLLALLVAITLATIVAFARDSLDRRFKSSHEVTDTLRLPLVGHVRDEVLGRTPVPSNGHGPLSGEELESFRILRTNVDFLDVDQPVKTLIVTSALPEEGKSTVAAGLAATYAAAGKRVLLVECDLRRPTLAERLGLEPTPGLSDYLAGNARPQEVLQTVSMSGAAADGPVVACITAGTRTSQPAELLGSAKFGAFLEQVEQVYDSVILDTCPLLSVSDTLELVPRADGVLLCVRTSRTTRNQIGAAKSALEHFPARPTGVVLTGLRPGEDTDYGYYSYAYAYGSRRT